MEWIIAAVPSVIASIIMLVINRRISVRDKQHENHEKIQSQERLLQLKMTSATLKLTEANAIALRDGRCNGELKAAMTECEAAKKAYYEFLNAQAYEHIT